MVNRAEPGRRANLVVSPSPQTPHPRPAHARPRGIKVPISDGDTTAVPASQRDTSGGSGGGGGNQTLIDHVCPPVSPVFLTELDGWPGYMYNNAYVARAVGVGRGEGYSQPPLAWR